MDAQRRAASGKPSLTSASKKRGLGSDAPGSSARGSEDRSSVAPPPPPRGTKRAREIEGIDKVCAVIVFLICRTLREFARCFLPTAAALTIICIPVFDAFLMPNDHYLPCFAPVNARRTESWAAIIWGDDGSAEGRIQRFPANLPGLPPYTEQHPNGRSVSS